MDFDLFVSSHPRHACPETLRYGQWLVNELTELDRGAVDFVIQMNADPFYDDRNLEAFWRTLKHYTSKDTK